ncbi:TonB-dependent receptor [Chitinimonas lacunae]|uniref:TonB-dependent receptor n=1 Tax=Chitinimonas lacunae TaxID=1963018 RepID=A0ABV8MUB7_9NEIS
MKIKTIAQAVAAIGVLLPAQVMAAETTQKVEKIEVTGTNIKRINKETASPVLVMTRDEIKRSGAQTVTEVIQNLTSSGTNGLNELGGGSSFAGGASAASLRSLGSQATLLLLNGRRLANYGFADGAQVTFANLDALPLEVIERVDVLKDGASAIYGSDAIAGVINVITRKDFKGLIASASGGKSTTHNDYDEYNATITAGFGDLAQNKYNAFVNYEYFKRENLFMRERMDEINPTLKRLVPTIGLRSTYSYPGNYIVNGRLQAVGNCPPQLVESGACRYDQWSLYEIVPNSERHTVFGRFNVNFNENLSGFAEASYSRQETMYNSPATYLDDLDSTWYNAQTGDVMTLPGAKLPANHPYNTTGQQVGFRYRFADMGNGTNKVTGDQMRVLAGLSGNFADWDLQGAIGYASSEVEQLRRGGMSLSGWLDAFAKGEYKFGQQNDAAVLAKIFPSLKNTGKSTASFFDIKGSREIAELPAGPLHMAIGIDGRHETYKRVNDDRYNRADIVNYGTSNVNGSRNQYSAFGELIVPVTQALEAQLALRGDKYSNYGHSVTPKVGLRFQVNPKFVLRGTYTEGFRAPNLPETVDGFTSAFAPNVEDPKRCDRANALYEQLKNTDPVRANRLLEDNCSASIGTLIVPNKDLQPEKSKSHTVGFVFEPTPSFSMTFDWYKITRRNEIDTLSNSDILDNEDKNPGSVLRDPLTTQDIADGFTVGQISALRKGWINYAKTKTSGIDIDAKYRLRTETMGRLNFGLEASYLLSYDRSTPGDPEVAKYVGITGYPRLRAVLKTDWDYRNWNTGLRLNFVDDMKAYTSSYNSCKSRGGSDSDCRIASFTTVDGSLSYTGVKNLELSLSVRNLFDRDTPIDYDAWVRDGTTANEMHSIKGRFVKLGAKYTFF